MDIGTIRSGILTIGVDASAPGPFHSGLPGTPGFGGFDVDLAAKVAGHLGLVPRFVECLWSSTFSALRERRFDLACTACTITEERRKVVDFSEPYLDAELVLITRGISGIHCLEDPEARKIAVRIATVAEEAVRAHANGKRVLTYDFNEDAYNALAAGEADAVVDDALIAPYFVRERRLIRVVGPIPNTECQYGMMFAKGNDQLRLAVNAALAAIQANGTYDLLCSRWFPERILRPCNTGGKSV